MRALVCKKYGKPDDLVLETLADPVPGPGQVAVQVKAAGINFPDVLSIAGKYQVKTEPPFVPGNEAAGIVTAVGDGVHQHSPGDSVMFLSDGGAFAERCLVEESMLMPIVPGLDFERAAGFTVTYGTSFHALHDRAQLSEGETVLVLGASGGVGVTAVQIAKAQAARVIAAASSDEKLEFAREMGADETINYGEVALNDAVKELTDGKGVDVVYDPVGGEQSKLALRATAWQGRFLVIGFASGDIPAFPANLALLKEASIMGVWWGTWARKNPSAHAANVRRMSDMISAGRLEPQVTERFSLADFRAAFAAITERRALGKVVLTMN